MKNSWILMRRIKPSHRTITDMAWLKLVCGLKNEETNIGKPILEYLRTPLQHCASWCPSRCRNSKKMFRTKWSYSTWRIFEQEKPTLEIYLQQILNETRLDESNTQNNKVRLQDLRVRGVVK